jgi:HflC protein
MKKSIMIVSSAAVILVLLVITGAFYTVTENEYANTIRFSKTIKTVSNAGLYFKMPFIDSVKLFPKQALLYDMTPSDVLTADSKTMQVDNYVIWKISDPLKFYQTLGSKEEAESRLDMLTYNAIKTTMGNHTRDEIINQNDQSRAIFNENITTSAAKAVGSYGIKIIDIKIKKLDLPEDNEQAVYRRMISERNKIAEQYRADGSKESEIIKNNVDKQVNILVSNAKAQAEALKAEGESEYMRILAQAYNTPDKQAFYEFTRALDALKTSLGGENKTVILGADSALAKILTAP